MKNLQLSLKAKWFELTKQGIKTEDYREINAYWFKRFVFNWEKVYSYVSISDKNEDIDVLNLCKDSFWNKTFAFKPFDCNTMTLGYPKSTNTDRILKLEHKGIEIRTGNPEWGAEPGKIYFVILHGKIIE